MSRILLVLALSGLAGAILWFATSSRTERGSRAPRPSSPAAQSARESHALEPARAASPERSERELEEPAAPPQPSAPAARREAATTKAAELERAQWIDGRVLFPAGTPDDEQVFVTADGRDFGDASDHRVQVERDGSFRVAFSEKTRVGRITLEARYLYMDEVVRWRSAEANGAVVLEPELGARIAGHVRLPAGTEAAGVGGELVLEVTRRSGSSFDDQKVSRHELSKGFDFAFDALAAGLDGDRSYEVSYDGEAFLGRSGKLVPEAGETLALELVLRPGLVLSGVVRDESGAPLERVELQAFARSNSVWTSANWRDARSEANGSFLVGALAGGEVELRAELDGHEPLVRELGRLEEGASVRDLVLVLARGTSISGTVRWPDGSPAEATLVLSPHLTSTRWKSERDDVSGSSDASGAFSINGLSQEFYRVTARALKTEEVRIESETVESEITGKSRPKKQRTHWSAEIDPVKAGTGDLVLTLSTGLAVSGRVVDDLGAPLADFAVAADRIEPGPDGFDMGGVLARSFRDTDGSFRMEGFAPGEWEVWSLCRDHALSERVRLTLPGGEPVVLVVPRESAVRGRVLDPGGAPVARAALEANREDAGRSQAFEFDREGVADEHGEFELDDLGPGRFVLRAHGSTFAPSEPQVLELRAGETLTDIVLRLRPGGTVLGELVDAGGRAQAGRMVSISDHEGFHASPETDAEGRFRAGGVPPGEFFLWAETLEGIRLQQQVTLAEGETVRVRLAPPDGTVRLHGQVRAGGEPLVSAQVHARAVREEERSSARASSSSRTDEQGAYEIQLPGSGRYWLTIQGDDDTSLSWRVTLEAPAVEALRFDVSIPLGRISGRVTDTHGQALVGVLVESQPARHEGGAHGSARVLTDAEGRYELCVPAGQHAVAAGGLRSSWFQQGQTPYVESRVSDLSVSENGHLRGIDLVLAKGGVLEGVARNADGSNASRVEVWSEESGAPGRSDENGRFELVGLAPGTHHVRARGRACATSESVRIEITAGETRRIELELVAATPVHLSVREKGAPVGSEIRVLDERGRPQFVETRENGEAWLGPLVPGRYTVRAQRDGQQVERAFEVTTGQTELELALVFE